jgi:hypothetical protein
MNLFRNLNKNNCMMYAMKTYTNPGAHNIAEFKNDLQHFAYIKRLLRRYRSTNDVDALKLRLVLNHIIIVYNVFSNEAATRILFLKMEKDLWSLLKSFLVFLSYMPEIVLGINGDDILSANITENEIVLNELGKIC